VLDRVLSIGAIDVRLTQRFDPPASAALASYPKPSVLGLLRQQAGMTVVELCVDVSLIALLSLSALVTAHNYLEWGRVRTAAKQVAGAFQQARQYAIANGATYAVTLTANSVTVACLTGCPPSAPTEPLTPIAGGATSSVPGSAITFNSMGAATPGTVTLTYPGATAWQVRVTAAGRVQACSPTCP